MSAFLCATPLAQAAGDDHHDHHLPSFQTAIEGEKIGLVVGKTDSGQLDLKAGLTQLVDCTCDATKDQSLQALCYSHFLVFEGNGRIITLPPKSVAALRSRLEKCLNPDTIKLGVEGFRMMRVSRGQKK